MTTIYSVNTIVSASSVNLIDGGRALIDGFVYATGSEGWTLVESRIIAGPWEWTVIKKPSSLGVVSKDYYVALAVGSYIATSYNPTRPSYLNVSITSGDNRVIGTIFESWNTSSKMLSLHCNSSRASRTLTSSYTDFVSPTFLPGSAFDCKFSTLALAFWANVEAKISANKENVAVYFASSRGSGWWSRGTFVTGKFDSVLSEADDPLPVYFGNVYCYVNSATVFHTFHFSDIVVLTSPLQSNDTMIYTFLTIGRGTNNFQTISNDGIGLIPPYDTYLNQSGISPCPIYKGFYSDTDIAASLRGLSPNFFIASSVGATPTRS